MNYERITKTLITTIAIGVVFYFYLWDSLRVMYVNLWHEIQQTDFRSLTMEDLQLVAAPLFVIFALLLVVCLRLLYKAAYYTSEKTSRRIQVVVYILGTILAGAFITALLWQIFS